MDTLGPFSAQTSVLSLLKAGTANLLAVRKQSAQNALLAELEKSDPEKTAVLKKDLQESQDMQRLASSRVNMAQQRKADAAEKIMRIKEQLAMLRLLAAVNPEAAARQAAQLSRELGRAVREYGGGGAALSAPTADAGTGATAGADTQTSVAPTGTQGAAETQITAEDKTAATSEPASPSLSDLKQQQEQNTQALRDKMQEKGAAASNAAAQSRADREFAALAKDVRNSIKNILEAAKRKLAEKGEHGDHADIKSAEAALQGASAAIHDLSVDAAPAATVAIDILT